MIELADRSRRSVLKIGALGLGGGMFTLPQFLAAKSIQPGLVKDRSVVFLFMHGGPSQTETFDPKMDQPSGIRSATGEISTSLPGVTFGSTFPKLAKLAHKLAIIRSFTTGTGAHDIKPIVGKNSLGANIGSLYARVAGGNDPTSGIPRNVALYPKAVDPEAMPMIKKFGDFADPGPLGAAFSPYEVGEGGAMQSDMTLRMARDRMENRRALLKDLDRAKQSLDSGNAEAMGNYQSQAFDMILGGISDAFDLSKEDPKTLARYDTAPLVNPNSIRKVWNNHQRYRDHSQTIGKLMLLARRLCERGAGFITVTTNFVWDMHADKNNATVTEGMDYVGAPFDHAVSAFIEDVEARGLSEKILLVCCGEMGRNPVINKNGGRDHWGKLAPLILYGGGLKTGQVIGHSDRKGGEPASNPILMENLTATLLHSLLDPGEVRLVDGLSNDVVTTMTSPQPIRELI
ncbi:DUF1501 domain-containing protein [Verrucomicrobiales bacterium]|jgi:hypothetical protein|nr:DUF1501 domain-containing protein [Verrucomicrobiales bacterium]MDC3353133.1 DUF1501 domain-containing protein [Verrucomicrobiales bacterium]